jgi:HSP20 family protein
MYGYGINCGCGPRQSRGRSLRNAAWPVQAWAAQQLRQAAQQVQTAAAENPWAPPVDVREDERAYYVSADLPGVDRDAIQLELEDGKLTLSGERQRESAEGQQWRWQGRRFGSFRRSFNLPRTVDAEAISAEYKDGVLQVTLPKLEQPAARQVSIA